MLTREEIIEKSRALGFADIGFTTADPFDMQREFLLAEQAMYGWTAEKGLDLLAGTDPQKAFPGTKSIIVLLEAYFLKSFPRSLEGKFGRCYLDDDRMTQDGLNKRLKAFVGYLRGNGLQAKGLSNLPQRPAATRAGLGTYGKNCLLYANRVVRQSSWVLPLTVAVDQAFAPDEPSIKVGCPAWCRNVCIVSCPTGALSAPRKLDPRKCISFLTYFGRGITPRELREPMGMWVYGCDTCQNVCPRNHPWLTQELPVNEKVHARAEVFDLASLLHMEEAYFASCVWPHMFYMPLDELWRWRMNAARAMGNSGDAMYVPLLTRTLRENSDERVRGMAAWALGRLGGAEAKKALEGILPLTDHLLKIEVSHALECF
jgi:epoxyqueuosine reductase